MLFRSEHGLWRCGRPDSRPSYTQCRSCLLYTSGKVGGQDAAHGAVGVIQFLCQCRQPVSPAGGEDETADVYKRQVHPIIAGLVAMVPTLVGVILMCILYAVYALSLIHI